jgi:hypothetical protein
MNMENVNAIVAGDNFILDVPSGFVDSALVPQPGKSQICRPCRSNSRHGEHVGTKLECVAVTK